MKRGNVDRKHRLRGNGGWWEKQTEFDGLICTPSALKHC